MSTPIITDNSSAFSFSALTVLSSNTIDKSNPEDKDKSNPEDKILVAEEPAHMS